MPAEILDDPLRIACVFSNGSGTVRPAGVAGNPVLGRQMLSGLAGLVHPHGVVDSKATVDKYLWAIRDAAAAFPGGGELGAAGLSRARVAEYLWGCPQERESLTRRMLVAFGEAGGALPGPVRELLEGRPFNLRRGRNHRPLAPYSESEWQRLRQACRQIADDSFAAHRAMLRAAGTGGDPACGPVTPQAVAWWMARNGPVSGRGFARRLNLSSPVMIEAGPWVSRARRALFAGTETVIAYRLLFGVLTGIVPDGIDGLGTGDLDWAGDTAMLACYIKGRTARESVTLGRAAVRLVEQWLAHTELARRFAPPGLAGALWLRYEPLGHGGAWFGGQVDCDYVKTWAARQGLLADDGSPLSVHRHRIRTTFQSLRDRKAWFGSTRATIDPNHSPQVEGDSYLTAATPAQRAAIDSIIADAQAGLVGKARPPVLSGGHSAAGLAARFPELAAGLPAGDEAIAWLAGGQQDVFTAACAGPLSGLHGPAGKPCPARPWVCLLCPLAVFTPRHAANLLRLKAFFARQWQQLPAGHFMAVFGPYAQRIEQVLACYDPRLLAAAASGVTGRDAELPLRAEELTQ